MKNCTRCKQTKPYEAFSKLARAKDGYQYQCKECKLEQQRANPNRKAVVKKYRDANREVCLERSKASQAKNKPYYSAKTMEWQRNNRERYLENRRAHYVRNSARDIERVRRRAGLIKQSETRMSAAELTEIQGMYDFCRIFPGFEVDHIIPLNGKTVSGLHILSNLQVISRFDNRSKGNKFIPV